MSLWTNVDDALGTGKPKSLNATNAGATYGVDVAEAQLKPVTHAGWVKVTTGTGGRAGRTQYETLVAMGSIATDAEDVVFADPTIIIAALTTPIQLAVGTAAYNLTATVTGTAKNVSYQWMSSANGVTYAAIAGATTTTLTIDPASVGVTYYKLVASVKASKTTAALSAESSVSVVTVV